MGRGLDRSGRFALRIDYLHPVLRLDQPLIRGEGGRDAGRGPRSQDVIGVEEDHHLPLAQLHPGIQRRSLPAVFLKEHLDAIRVGAQQRSRVIGRTVVDDDHA